MSQSIRLRINVLLGSTKYSTQYIDEFKAHDAAIMAVKWNQFHPDVFATCSQVNLVFKFFFSKVLSMFTVYIVYCIDPTCCNRTNSKRANKKGRGVYINARYFTKILRIGR